MSISEELFEKWQFASESDSLDFKRDQYKFIGATDPEKTELLKDILAMANSWCESDAHIVIGIEDLPSKPNTLHGITDHIDDASLQQFVNGKTATICRFEYINYTSQGLTFGILRIPRQTRPIYLKRNYAGLKANTVYVRRGSSTDEASPSEIALMGKGAGDNRKAQLRLGFYDSKNGISLGNSITVSTKELSVADNIPDYIGSGNNHLLASLEVPNKNFYREMIAHINFGLAYVPLVFCVENTGNVEAVNIRIEMEFPTTVFDLLVDGDEIVAPESSLLRNFQSFSKRTSSGISVDSYNDRWVATTHLERLHAKRKIDLRGCLYMKVKDSLNVPGKIKIFCDGQSSPDEMELNIQVEYLLVEKPWSTVLDIVRQ